MARLGQAGQSRGFDEVTMRLFGEGRQQKLTKVNIRPLAEVWNMVAAAEQIFGERVAA